MGLYHWDTRGITLWHQQNRSLLFQPLAKEKLLLQMRAPCRDNCSGSPLLHVHSKAQHVGASLSSAGKPCDGCFCNFKNPPLKLTKALWSVKWQCWGECQCPRRRCELVPPLLCVSRSARPVLLTSSCSNPSPHSCLLPGGDDRALPGCDASLVLRP